MKIRNGFVSNSSSSSFLIVGREVKRDELRELRKRAKELHLGPTMDNTQYDPHEWCGCEAGHEDESCNCQYFTVYFGFGEAGDEGSLSDTPTHKVVDYITKAEKLFGGPVDVFYGQQGNE